MRSLLRMFFALVLVTLGMTAAAQPAPTLNPPAASTTAPANPVKAIAASHLARNIVVITIHDAIDRVTASSVARRMNDAKALGADLVVIELNTPGGEVGAVLDICSTIKQSPIRTVAWINTQAYSGGAIVALACNEMIVSDPVQLGDAKPIEFGPGGIKSIDKDLLMKLLPPLIGSVVDSAQRRNHAAGKYLYDELLVQGIIVSDAELWQIENLQTGQRMCVTSAEFRMLFPDQPLDGTPMLAGAGSVSANPLPPKHSAPDPNASPNSASVTPPAPATGGQDLSFVGASPLAQKTAATVADASEGLLSTPSLRPRLSPADKGQWKLIGKVSGGTGPLVFNDKELAYFGFAENLDANDAIIPIRNDTDLTAYYNATIVTRLDQSWIEDAVGFLSNPFVRGILIVIFLIGIFIEGSHPGLFVPGIVGGIALILLIAPPLLTGLAAWWAAAAIIAGLIFIAAEIFLVPGSMIAGLIGFVLLFGGLVGTFIPLTSGSKIPSNTFGHDLSLGLATVVLSMGTALIAMFFLGKYFGSLPILRRMVLPNPDQVEDESQGDEQIPAMKLGNESDIRMGATACVLSPLRPTGTIEVGDQVVEASVALGFVSAGATVRIVKVLPNKVVVELVSDGPPPEPIAELPLPTPEDLK